MKIWLAIRELVRFFGFLADPKARSTATSTTRTLLRSPRLHEETQTTTKFVAKAGPISQSPCTNVLKPFT